MTCLQRRVVNGVNSTSYVKTAGDLTPFFFKHVHTLLIFANALNDDTKMLIACEQEAPIYDPLDKMSTSNVLTLSASQVVKPVLDKDGLLKHDFWC